MAAPKDDPDSEESPKAQPVEVGPRRYWIFENNRILGPFGVRLLRRLKTFGPDLQVAPAGSRKEKDWKPAAQFPELKAIIDERAAAQAPQAAPGPKKGKPAKAPLPPLPEGPNYLLWFLLFVLAVGAVIAITAHQASREEARPRPATGQGQEPVVTPEQMWPAPDAPAERVEAEGRLLENYFPLLVAVKGVKAEQVAAACVPAKDFMAGYTEYKSKFGAAKAADFSERVTLTMEADQRTAKLQERLEAASSRGVDLSSLKYPKVLRQNMQPADFSLPRALTSAEQLLSSFCEKR